DWSVSVETATFQRVVFMTSPITGVCVFIHPFLAASQWFDKTLVLPNSIEEWLGSLSSPRYGSNNWYA
ncbi:hypothetical protein JTM38_32835, partial [Pseudomonas aeruginosa]|nr:hypothetical protein [Pseudomonas aeruginosa]MBN0069935.1 hypothetical protein [Pseudomonas aeruginosa]MBN0105434.1 hypothetical protein [Pseudomonas aeruginosa]MBN0280532.1 hypothetical protein [Pseudomonas aeruginosa]MBN0342773.1 hypothetical protein [Pseudomonas aeruginosa]